MRWIWTEGGKIREMYHRLAHLNRALGITDKTVRSLAASHLIERRALEAGNVAAALAAATPVEDNLVFAGVPMEARLRVAERAMAEAEFAHRSSENQGTSPLNPDFWGMMEAVAKPGRADCLQSTVL